MSETREEYNARKKRERANKLPQLAEKARIARANESPEKRADRLEKAKLKQREWRLNNPNHANTKLSKRNYKLSARGKAMDSKHRVARRIGIKKATPLWVDMNTIADVYMEAEYMQMQVDHIVPLKNNLVCGLHTWDNLQLLNPLENNKKGNRYWPDMPA